MAEGEGGEDSWGKSGWTLLSLSFSSSSMAFKGSFCGATKAVQARQPEAGRKLESPHSCRNQLVDAAVGLCA